MILPIYLYGQAVLRKEAEDVPRDYPELKPLIQNMFETLLQAEGCGLAAPQVGLGLRLFIVDGTELKEEYPECANFKQAFINPEVLEESEEKVTYSEGCLSLPGISENVIRPKSVKVRYYDEDWQLHEEELTGFNARIFEHEFDHLQGNVFTDRISPIRRQFVSTKLQKIAKGKTTGKYKCKRNG
ncbi:MAG: peptide deformylase [Paludibacteraceae bacterium]|nr:peptide deformylase [Paludibacteraceae bacterium]